MLTAEDKPSTRYRKRADAAQYLREHWGFSCTANSLAKLASQGGGPIYRRAGGKFAVYATECLDEWAESKLSEPVRSTSEYRPPRAA